MRLLPALVLSTLAIPLGAQTSLHQQIATIAAGAKGKVSVGCSLPGVPLNCSLRAEAHVPMQSVFKFPLAIIVLRRVEAGKLSLDQPVRFLASDRYPGTHSPLQDAHPEANVDVPLRELLHLSVSFSDNVATDILLRVVGGPQAVQRSLNGLGFPQLHVVDSEAAMHDDEQRQYRNDTTPVAMVSLLRRVADRSPLTPEHTALLEQWMQEPTASPKRIRGALPPGTVVAHKSGSSGTEKGMTAATNDVGLITLPDGRRLAIAIFITDSHEDTAALEPVIAGIAKAVYDAAVAATPR
jgi:beta-lactamase class A